MHSRRDRLWQREIVLPRLQLRVTLRENPRAAQGRAYRVRPRLTPAAGPLEAPCFHCLQTGAWSRGLELPFANLLLYCVGNFGGRTRTRTLDPLIKSQLLYQLSYAPPRVAVRCM